MMLRGLALLLVLYFGSYLAIVVPGYWDFDESGDLRPRYRFGGDAADAFFFPAFTVDSLLRPELWEFHLSSGNTK